MVEILCRVGLRGRLQPNHVDPAAQIGWESRRRAAISETPTCGVSEYAQHWQSRPLAQENVGDGARSGYVLHALVPQRARVDAL